MLNHVPHWAQLERRILDARYDVIVAWDLGGKFSVTKAHEFRIAATNKQPTLEFTVGFYPGPSLPSMWPSVDLTKAVGEILAEQRRGGFFG